MIETSNGFIPTPDMGEQWLTPKEFARILKCSERHVRYLTENTTLASFGIRVYSVKKGSRTKRYILTPLSML